jgi:hypothetical protein
MLPTRTDGSCHGLGRGKEATPKGVKRYQGTYCAPRVQAVGRRQRQGALDAARDAERCVECDAWIDVELSRATFAEYVETLWWPHQHVEITRGGGDSGLSGAHRCSPEARAGDASRVHVLAEPDASHYPPSGWRHQSDTSHTSGRC